MDGGWEWLVPYQIFCIFLFLCAASLFGTLISQINEIVNQSTSISKEIDVILEMYLAVEPKYVVLLSSLVIGVVYMFYLCPTLDAYFKCRNPIRADSSAAKRPYTIVRAIMVVE